MSYFWETSETISKGVGFSHFGPLHLAELAVFALLCAVVCIRYRRTGQAGRRGLRRIVAGLLLADELLKHIVLLATGAWLPEYLPLHLCSINILLIAVHAVKPSRTLDSFLYCICLPAAMAALLFPSWTKLPLANFMHLHSLSAHILLVLYPLMQMTAGEIRRDFRQIPKCLLFLLALAIPVFGLNYLLDTNFMFLQYAPKGNPLRWFKTHLGHHWIGFPVLITAVLLVLHLPLPKKRR